MPGKAGKPMEMCPSDLCTEEWELLEPLIPPGKSGGRPRCVDMRAVLNGIFYVLRSGCAWRILPREYPPRSTVYHYFAQFRDEGVWEQLMTTLRERCRVQAGREPTPSAGIIDSQSVRATERGGPRGYDGGKKLSGRKRHILVDTMGLLLKVVVHVASISDREGVRLLLEPLKGVFPRMKKVWLDVGYSGKGQQWIEQEMGWEAEIVKHAWTGLRGVWVPKGTEVNWEEIIPPGFHALPRRWVVERTFGWLSRNRRLSKDYERKVQTSETLIEVAMIRLLIARKARRK